MANTEVNKVLTLFEVETKNFTKDVKAAEKNVENLKKQFKETNKQVDALKKDIKGLGEEIDKLDDLDLEIDASNLKREVATAQKELAKVEDIIHDIDKAADGALDGLKDGNIDLRVFTRIEDMLRRMGDIDVIDIDSIRRASNEVYNLVSDLKDIDTDISIDIQSKLDDLSIELDTGRLSQLKLNLDDNLRHWIDNNNGGLGQASDDTHKVLQDILMAVRNVTTGEEDRQRPQQELDTDKFEKASDAMTTAVKESNTAIKSLAAAMKESAKDTDEYVDSFTKIKNELNGIGADSSKAILDDNAYKQALGKIPEYAEEEFRETVEKASVAAKQVADEIHKIFNTFDHLEVKSLQDIVGSLDKIDGATQGINRHLTVWEDKVHEAANAYSKALNELEKQRKELDMLEGAGASDEQTAELRRQIKLLEEKEQAAKGYWSYTEKVNDSLKQQRSILAANRKEHEQLLQQNKEQLNQEKKKQEALEKQKKAYDDAKKNASEIGKAFEPLANATGLDKITGSLGTITTSASSATKGVSGLGKAIGSMSGGAVAALGAVGAALSGLVAAVGSYVAIKYTIQETLPAYIDLEDAITRVQTAMGDMAGTYEETKTMLTDGFANQGHVQDVNEYADALARVNQQLVDLAGFDYADASEATKDILAIADDDVTGYDPNEIIRSVRNMSINFGIEVSKALDMITSAYQKTGDPMNDLLDTMQEYPSQFKKMGISAETFYDLIVRGSEAGVYNTDKIADTFKELYLRIAEGADIPAQKLKEIGYSAEDIARVGNATDAVIEAFNSLGMSVNSIKQAFEQGGDAADTALYTIIDAIAAVENKAEQQEIIANLFGAPGEDVGSYFFEVLANGEIAIDEFVGAVENASAMMESTLSYQMTEVTNKVTSLKAEIGDTFGNVLTLALQDINANFDQIANAVTGSLIPALDMLGFALVDPFIEGEQSASDFIVSVIEGVSSMIEGLAMVINFFNGVVAAIRIVTNAIEILWNALQMVWDGLNLLALSIIDTFGSLFAKIIDGAAILVTNFKVVCENMGIAARNGAAAIYNAFGEGFSKVQQSAAKMLNSVIEGINHIPGVNINYRASWGDGFEKKGYEAYKELKAVTTYQDKVSGYVDPMVDKYKANFDKNFDDMMKDIGDMGDAWDDIWKTSSFDKRFNEIKDKLDIVKKEQKEINKEANKQPVKPPVTDKHNGTNTDSKKTADDIAKAEKAAKESAKKKNDLKKKEQELQKELNELLKKEKALQKEIFDEIKRQIELEKQYADDRRSWEEAIMAQQVKLRQDKEEALLLEMAMIDEIRQKYALTAEEQISYQQKQFDLALSLRDHYLSFYKDAINKEIQAIKDRSSEELKIEKRKNDKLIKEKERQIKAIEALMRENEYQNDQEDLDHEIRKTEEELQKYLYATSFDGINKRNELEERLRELKLEKERAAKKKDLEDQKQQLEDEIDNIKDANEEAEKTAQEKAEAMEKIYDDMFKELEEVINSGMFDIGKIQELAQKETNSNIKKMLDNMVNDYQTAMKLIEKYTLNMKDIISWDKNDANNDIIEGGMTGDKDKVNNGQDILDKNENWQPGGSNASESTFKQAQAKYNKLKKEHSSLSAKKNKTAADKARLKTIEKEVAELKKVWGFSGFQDTSKFKPVNTQANVVGDKINDLNNQLNASKDKKKSRMSIPDYIRQVPSLNNTMNPQVLAADAGQRQNMQMTTVNNNNQSETKIDSMIKIENFNNNSNADIKKIGQQLNSTMAVHDRALGKRRI